MRIAYLGDPENLHTRRWVNFFSNRGHHCAIFCDPPVVRPFEGVEIICPHMSLARKAVAFKMVHHPYSNNLFKAGPYARAVRHWRPDIVHGFEALAYGYATAKSRSAPRVLTPWGNDIFDWPMKSKLARYLVQHALDGASVISTNAPGLEVFLDAEYRIPRAKVNCFSWGVERTVFHANLAEQAEAFARRFNIPASARVVLSPRQTKPYWGIEIIVDALGEMVRRGGRDLMVVFLRGYGDLEFCNTLRRRVEAEGLSANARFIAEPLTQPDLAAAFNRSFAFISVPETDLLSNTVLEGMACGSVPLLADNPYYRARVQEDVNGFYLRERTADGLVEAFSRAIASPAKLDEMAKRNIQVIVQEEDWRKRASQMEGIYDDLARKRRR